jgi:DNA repair protein RecO (recombination protein O)
LFYTADFSFSRSRRSELHALREVSLRETHSGLRRDLAQLQQACYCANLVEQATEMETPLAGVFELMTGLMAHLAAEDGIKSLNRQTSSLREAPSSKPQTIFAFELKLLTDLGLKPDLDESRLSPGTKQLVNALTENDWPMVPRLRLSEAQIRELDAFLNGFLVFNLGRIPKGRNSAVGAASNRLPAISL